MGMYVCLYTCIVYVCVYVSFFFVCMQTQFWFIRKNVNRIASAGVAPLPTPISHQYRLPTPRLQGFSGCQHQVAQTTGSPEPWLLPPRLSDRFISLKEKKAWPSPSLGLLYKLQPPLSLTTSLMACLLPGPVPGTIPLPPRAPGQGPYNVWNYSILFLYGHTHHFVYVFFH